MKVKWTKTVPADEGWYWIKYRTKHGLAVMPCSVTRFKKDDIWIVQTARNDSFYSHTPLTNDVRFGPRIEEPELEAKKRSKRKGERERRRKREQRAEILSLRRDGLSQTAIGEQLNCSRHTVRQALASQSPPTNELWLKVHRLKREGLSQRAISEQLNCSRHQVIKALLSQPKVIAGRKYGQWTAIEEVADTQPLRWLCRCKCGNETKVIASLLLAGSSIQCQDCRSLKRITDLSGRKYGKWTVIKLAHFKRGKAPIWVVECECGERAELTWQEFTRQFQCDDCCSNENFGGVD